MLVRLSRSGAVIGCCTSRPQDNPIGDWDGIIEGKQLCNFASLEHTRLVPICDVMPGKGSHFILYWILFWLLMWLLSARNLD